MIFVHFILSKKRDFIFHSRISCIWIVLPFLFISKNHLSASMMQCFPVEVPQLISTTIQVTIFALHLLQQFIISHIVFSYMSCTFDFFMQKLVVICLSGADDRDPSKTAVKTSTAAILARILVMNTNYLAQLTSEPSFLAQLHKAGFSNEEGILLCLVDVWLDRVRGLIEVLCFLPLCWENNQ